MLISRNDLHNTNNDTGSSITIVIPAKNEAHNLTDLLPALIDSVPPETEIIVVDDGSTDSTVEVCGSYPQVRVHSHQYSLGNGAAVKAGARRGNGDILVFMDADGQHSPEYVQPLAAKIQEGYDMAVGARQMKDHASVGRIFANGFYNRLASWMTGYQIADLTSGFRAVRADKFRRFLYLLPNKFSYPTTSTMAFFRSGYSVVYIPIRVHPRGGKSHIRLLQDGLRFFVIILKIGALFSPMRLFLPISGSLFVMGACYYVYTYFSAGRFTNMSALLLIAAIITFLIGIVSEQISALHYKDTESYDAKTD